MSRVAEKFFKNFSTASLHYPLSFAYFFFFREKRLFFLEGALCESFLL